MSGDTTKDMKHPMQPVGLDDHGVLRFKRNAIVEYILDNGDIDLNDIACKDFTREDRAQFAQLIGYSVSGFSELGYASDEECESAQKVYEEGLSEKDALIKVLEEKLANIKKMFREGVSELYCIHPDDLN